MSHRPARVTWLILPVVCAGPGHIAVLRAHLFDSLAIPLDGGRRWRGRPLFGPNKTRRGPVLMAGLTAIFTQIRAHAAASHLVRERVPLPTFRTAPSVAGATVGRGYSLAELPNSCMKRQFGTPAGGHSGHHPRLQYLIDQIDSVVGCAVALLPGYRVAWRDLAPAMALGVAVHVAIDRLMYAIGVKRHRR